VITKQHFNIGKQHHEKQLEANNQSARNNK